MGRLAKYVLPPLLLTVVTAVIGGISLWVQEPLLIPSLGSAIFLQTMTPQEPSARAWNTGIGQAIGAAAGFVAVFVTDAASTPHFMGAEWLMLPRVIAAAVAVFVTSVLQRLLAATTAAGGATALVVTLGAETATAAGAVRLATGIVLVTLLGEASRRLILRVR